MTINAEAVITAIGQHYPRASLDEAGRRSWAGSLRRLVEIHGLTTTEIRRATRLWLDSQPWPPNAPIELIRLALSERRRLAVPEVSPDLGPPEIRSRRASAWMAHCCAVMAGDRPLPEGLARGGAAEERWHRAMVDADLDRGPGDE